MVLSAVHHEETASHLGIDSRAYCARNALAFLGSARRRAFNHGVICIQRAIPRDTNGGRQIAYFRLRLVSYDSVDVAGHVD